MSTDSARLQELLANNGEFAKSYTTPPAMVQMREAFTDSVSVVTCMDPRVVPEQFLGPNLRAAVLRNAGGRHDPDVVRSVTILRSLAYKSKKVTLMVVHHTDCGMTHLYSDRIREDIRARGGEIGEEELGNLDFKLFTAEDLDKVVREDVEKFKAEKLLEGVDVRGYVLSTETGQLREV